MDIYSTNYLNGVVESLKRTPAFILNTAFRNQVQFQDETVYFDIELDGTRRRLAPVVHPLAPGKLVESRGYETKSITPAYIKDKRVHDPTKPFKRAIGETIGTGQQLTPMQRCELAVRRDLIDQTEIMTRRMEVWAVEIVRTGQCTIVMKMPDGAEKTFTLNFGRDASQTITLTSGNKWSDSGVNAIDDLEDWSMNTLKLSGSSIKNIIMDPDAWRAFRNKPQFEKRLDLLRVKSGQIDLGLLPEHVQYKGNDGTFDYWVYADWFLADEQTTEQVMLPSGTVIGLGDMLGTRHFGAIKDEDAHFQAREIFVKSWTKKDPSVRLLLAQSAPVLAPYRPNACFCANVL